MMTGNEKVVCILIVLGFLLLFAGFIALAADLPTLGAILGVSGLLSFLSTFWVTQMERKQKKEEDSLWYK